ncbi:Vegetative incompatibility protein HET-E-1 [Cyphellophora attinorum]|uniref:Vegetative incompatibility protein HET-E-1 n=1 Tax=Cyphellophora attinorum TaxID=1664694 RepID=A0A0N1HGK0_9EURO|nr:Vegetative incompatibility protein HET-E-1 [Phialophora attinorum]KPI44746.1 Vegetative incompatibility protein HET-E-1 [Phialophora attinorum]
MRLLNAETLEIESFTGSVSRETPYTILSHTWENDEVSFEDMKDLSLARTKAGFAKIEAAAAMSVDHGVKYIWIDTCCIDKSSSAELSEAINSMFRWYKDASVCFAFLSDLKIAEQGKDLAGFRDCRWWTRGWTLQELLAPAEVLFLDEAWTLRGSKTELVDAIQSITGIEAWVLVSSASLSTVPLAKRMSWAANRQTTRVEDMAYSLLGIFDVNLPLIYGEDSKAFIRLQEEILRTTTDLSLFAWHAGPNATFRGVLAQSPYDFRSCNDIVTSDDQFRFRDEIVRTNKGIKVRVPLQNTSSGLYIMDLHCYKQNATGSEARQGILLKRVMDVYVRASANQTVERGGPPTGYGQVIYLCTETDDNALASGMADDRGQHIQLTFPKNSPRYKIDDVRAVPEVYWQGDGHYFSYEGLRHFRCFVRFRVTSRTSPTELAYGAISEKSSRFILFCELGGSNSLRTSLYAETGLQSSPAPAGFIDPFRNIDQYGPLGDPFSLSVLSPGGREDKSVRMIHENQRHNYTVSTHLVDVQQSPPFDVSILITPSDEYGTVFGAQYAQLQNISDRPTVAVPSAPALGPGGANRLLRAAYLPLDQYGTEDPWPDQGDIEDPC